MKINRTSKKFHRLRTAAGRKWISLAVGFFAVGCSLKLSANPTGMTVVSGTATSQQNGSQLNITTSQAVFLNWSSFNIQQGETTTFIQPSVNSIAINVIGSVNPSQIWGNLNANGTVILANANGFYFGPNSMIKVGGDFIATTAPLTPNFGSGSSWTFTGMPPLASIINYGSIQAGNGRSLFLIAENIQNSGSLNAPGGNIGLAAGQTVLVSERPDGRGLSASVQVPSGAVNNLGQITADAGTIALQAQVVNQNGIIQANSVQNQNGVIELIASDQLTLGANSQIIASGDNSPSVTAGGNVTLQSGNTFSDSLGSQIVTTGGAHGGNGGNVAISAPNVLSLNSGIDARAQGRAVRRHRAGRPILLNSGINARAPAAWTAGTLLLDPDYIILDTSGSGSAGSGTVLAGSNPGSTLDLNVNSAFANLAVSQIILQAAYDITLAGGTTWNLSGTIGANFGGVTSGQLTLEAGRNIIFGNGAKLKDANHWSATLLAGYDFVNNVVQSGTGNIYLNGGSGLSQNGTIQLSAGSINLSAGQSILVGSGSVFTTGGGSIYVDALAGDINAGTFNGGSTSGGTSTSDYLFTASGSRPNTFLGGISTAAGGDVTLIAGNNIASVPTVPVGQWPGASGAYGAGDVTVIAGNQITGNYTLANGTGTLLAGVPVSSAQAGQLQNRNTDPTAYATALNNLVTAVQQTVNPNGNIGAASGASGPVTLSLINGSWNAWAANNIYLKEVNNPNGTFNSLQSFLFNYAPDAAANFWAGNAIELVGANLTRVARQNQTMPPIYAPVLSLNAGAGGITIDKSIILYPSSEGALEITTRAGGNLIGAPAPSTTVLNGITMSDSGSAGWSTFATSHAATPLHLNDPNPVTLDISGSIESFGLTVPTFADITVGGDAYNFGFIGQNLSSSQTTSINVTGNITYRGDLTSGILSSAISSSVFNEILTGDPALAGTLRYDATTGTLSFVGVMGSATEQTLLNPTDASGNVIFTGAQLTAWQTAITQLYAASQSASLGDNGLALSGPGNFNIKANSIDLGISGGISVLAPINVATSVPVDSLFSPLSFKAVLDGDPELASKLKYDAASGTLIFSGVMSPAEFYFLSLYQSPDFSPSINKLYAENQKDILGANLNVTTAGNLEMTATKIANEGFLGGINLTVGGTLDIGGEFTAFGDPDSPKGIFTTSGGNVSVAVSGNVNVDGSRIAAYNGGSITVESFNGDVNAGNGGSGYVSMNALELDPITGQLVSIPAAIPGSGILATTLPGSDATLGNILVEAPNGNISASAGGIIQLSFNKIDASKAVAYVLAGYELRDANGLDRLTAQDLSSSYRLENNSDSTLPLPDNLFDDNGVLIGKAIYVSPAREIDASGSGVIAQNIAVRATGKALGVFVSKGYVDIGSHQPGPIIIFAPGPVTYVGPIDPNTRPLIISQTTPDVNGLTTPQEVPQSNVTKENAETADDASTVVSKTDGQDDGLGDDDLNQKKGKGIMLAQKTGRVTIILPPRQQPPKAQPLYPKT